MRIFVLGNAKRPGVLEAAERSLPFLRQHCEIVVCDLVQEFDLSTHVADLTLVLGGDGAILPRHDKWAIAKFQVLGVNLGKLGFLADLSFDELISCFPQVARNFGCCRITRHLMFECIVESPDGKTTFLGLNEVALQTGPPFHMIEVDLIIDGEAVSRYGGDGLIISTPIGSTAHNLSAGGPILGQELSAFVITPICPHTLSNRPVVDSADKSYTIAIRRASPGMMLILDGQEMVPMTTEHRVTVRKAPVTFGLAKVPGRSYYQTLRDKLRWGTQPNFRVELSDEAERKNG